MKNYFSKKMIKNYGKHNVLTNILIRKNNKNNFITVDYLMAPIISILNSKGYYTKYSCSGHYDYNDHFSCLQIYILFYKSLEKDIIPKGFLLTDENKLLEPDIYVKCWEENSRKIEGTKNTKILLRKESEKFLRKNKLNTKNNKINYMVKYLNILYNWANKLPNKEEK